MGQALTKEFLRRAYCKQGLSTWAIEAKYGFSRSAVYAALRRCGIQSRTLAASHMRYARADFIGGGVERAYLTGFAMGDLRVRRHGGERSETISIACGSTKPAQIRLVERLFSRYGRVWKGRPDARGAVNVEAFVNETFSFLLPERRDYSEYAAAEHFFPFLAGFTDAEGSLFIANKQARIAWGNYDTDALRFIRSGLERFGVATPSMYCDSLRGYVGSHGYARKKNYCHVVCTKKDEVAAVLDRLEPYMRHDDKRSRAALLRDNLRARIHDRYERK